MTVGSRRSVRVTIRGRVQGVGFRAWTARRAGALGLSGWVCNRADGTVEALFSGPVDAVQAMIGDCRVGPKAARVEAVDCLETDEAREGGFVVLNDH